MTHKIISVRSIPSHGKGVYCAPAIYEARPRQSDGVLTWRCVDPAPCGTILLRSGARAPAGRRSVRLAFRDADDLGARLCLRVWPGVRHGQEATQDIEVYADLRLESDGPLGPRILVRGEHSEVEIIAACPPGWEPAFEHGVKTGPGGYSYPLREVIRER